MSEVPIPGTVHLVDIQGTSHLQHGADAKDIILVPQPTNDPNDPLNWSPKRKLLSSCMQLVLPLLGGMAINGLTPAYLLIQEETGIQIADLNTGNGLMYLFFGFGNLITQPFALNYGRRPAAVGSMFITSFLVLWGSFMNSTAEWYANRILVGIFFSSIECLIELCITDTKFTHERGFHMGAYNFALFGGALFAPIPAGFLADAAGWRWINRMYSILCFVSTMAMFLFMEETMFYRHGRVDEFLDAAEEKSSDDEHAATQVNSTTKNSPKESPVVDENVGSSYQVKTFGQKLKMWGARDPRQPNTFIKFFFLPITLLRYPGIVFSGILVGGVLAWYNVLLGTITQVFSGAPYNFSANMVGLTYLSCVLGTAVGCSFSGWLNDTIATWLARRNNGVKEPEARLWVAVIPLILHPAGCILYGVGAAHEIHWVGLCFGIGIITLSIVMGSTLSLSYCIDCYKEIAGEALVSVILIRNVMGKSPADILVMQVTRLRCTGFAFAYAVVPMVNNLGLQNAFLLVGFLGMGLNGLCFVMIAFGKKLRKVTASSYWRLVEEHGFQAH